MASELPRRSTPSFQRWKTAKRDSKWLKKMGPSLLVVAALIATVTYQAALCPPGGISQEKNPQAPGSNEIINDDHQRAGEAVSSILPTSWNLLLDLQ